MHVYVIQCNINKEERKVVENSTVGKCDITKIKSSKNITFLDFKERLLLFSAPCVLQKI